MSQDAKSMPTPDEASTVRAIRHATLEMVASCDEETLAAVVSTLSEHGIDTYAAVTRKILGEESPNA